MGRKDWNDTVLEHPELEIADKLVYHLLVRFGGDDLPVRRQIADLLQRSERHIRRVCVRLRQHGFTVDDAPGEAADALVPADTHVRERGHPCPKQRTSTSGADTHVRNNGPLCPKRTPMSEARTPMSEEADTHVRNNGHPCPKRTPMSEARTPMSDGADTHVRNPSYPHSARTPMSETDTHVRGNGHPCPARTPMSAPPTRTRTLWSSSSEEDSSCTAVPPSSSSSPLPSSGEGRGGEGGLGGEKRPEEKTERKTPAGGEKKNTPGEETENTGEAKPRKIPPSLYLSQMQSWWDAIWPDNLEEEIPWFGQLWEEFGEEIPVQALRQFAESRRTLKDLTYPKRFQRYFHTCCRNAQQGSPPPPEKPSSPSASRPSRPEGNGRYSTAAESSPEPAVRAPLEKPSVPVPRRPSLQGNGHRWPSLPEGNGRPRPSLPEGNGRRRAAAESPPASAADTEEAPGRTDFSAEEVQLKEDLVNHLATFWAHQADTPPTRSADHFLASFRRERRRP